MSDSSQDTGLSARRIVFGVTIGVWLALDLVSKAWLFALLETPESPEPGGPHGRAIWVLDGLFRLSAHVNSGAAFGMGRDNPLAVYGLSVVLLPILLAMAWRDREKGAPLWALGMVVGGALGNLYDRTFETGVRDFFDIVKPWTPPGTDYETLWPVFNVADIGIVVGMGVYFLWVMLHSPKSNPDDSAS